MGNRKESLERLERAYATRQKFVAAAPESPEDQFDLARTTMYLAQNMRRFGICGPVDELVAKARVTFQQQGRQYTLAELNAIPACSAN
jgi:hypothetical protein